MKICDRAHTEICFEGLDCPLCLANEKLDEVENDLDNMRDECEIAQERVKELELELDPEPKGEINEDDPRKER